MAVITVPASGGQSTDATLNDSLQVDGTVDQKTAQINYDLSGHTVLQSLDIGYALVVNNNDSLTGSGKITGPAASTVYNPPLFFNYGTLDINGEIDVNFDNSGSLTVSSGERLAIEGDFLAFGTETVAAGGELDINSVSSAQIVQLDLQGTLVVTAPVVTLFSASTLNGAITVHGDATNGYGSGAQAARSTGALYLATLDLTQVPTTTPLPNLTLGADAEVQFGVNGFTIKTLSVTGSSSAMNKLDRLTVDGGGTVTVTGDGSGSGANKVSLSAVELANSLTATGGVFDFTVTAAKGGAVLTQTVQVDAGVTLRNDGAMTLGTASSGTTMLGGSGAAAGSSFINASGATLAIGGGASLSVASLTNDGAIDITAGKVAVVGGLQGAGTVKVENGATFALSNAASFAGTLQLGGTAVLDLTGVSASAVSIGNGVIDITTTSGTLSLKQSGLTSGATLHTATDGAGGTLFSLSDSALTSGGGSSPGDSTLSPVSVYRFFDSVHGTEFFTSDAAEKANIVANRPDLTQEGVGLHAVNPAANDPNAAPIFRFFDTKLGTHFYTSSTAERDQVQSTRADLTYEGTGFYEHATQQAGDVAVYRFFETGNGTHFYTSSAAEAASIAATRPDFTAEGIGFYAPPTA